MPVELTPQLAGLPVGWAALLGVINLLGLGALGKAWMTQRSAYKKVELDGDEKLRSEMWRDIEKLKEARESQSRRLTMAEAKIASQTVQIGQLRFISALVVDELERLDPRNSIARQARLLLDSIQPDAMPNAEEIAPMADILAKMSKLEGTNE